MPGQRPDPAMQACIDWLRSRRPYLYAFARLQAGYDLDAEELLSETVKNVASALADNRLRATSDDMTPYAFTCMRHTASNWRKRHVRRALSERAYGEEAPCQFDGCPWLGVPEDADYLQRLIARHMQKLPAAQAEIIMLKIWSGLKTTQIARVANIPKSTVDSRYRLALEKLRQMISADPDATDNLP